MLKLQKSFLARDIFQANTDLQSCARPHRGPRQSGAAKGLPQEALGGSLRWGWRGAGGTGLCMHPTRLGACGRRRTRRLWAGPRKGILRLVPGAEEAATLSRPRC